MEWITEVLKEHFGSFIGMVLSGLAGWFFGRPKQQMELQTNEPGQALDKVRENLS